MLTIFMVVRYTGPCDETEDCASFMTREAADAMAALLNQNKLYGDTSYYVEDRRVYVTLEQALMVFDGQSSKLPKVERYD